MEPAWSRMGIRWGRCGELVAGVMVSDKDRVLPEHDWEGAHGLIKKAEEGPCQHHGLIWEELGQHPKSNMVQWVVVFQLLFQEEAGSSF